MDRGAGMGMEEKDEVSESRKRSMEEESSIEQSSIYYILLYIDGLNYLNCVENDKGNQIRFYEIDRMTGMIYLDFSRCCCIKYQETIMSFYYKYCKSY